MTEAVASPNLRIESPAGPGAAAALEIRDLHVSYGRSPILDGLDLTMAAGETLAILGPSGAGKSTLLAAVAGFVRPGSGEIRIAGRLVFGGRRSVAPDARNVGVVFQSYALWPHMTALDTVAFPYRRRGLSNAEARQRAVELLDKLGIGPLAGRRPAELSGGEQQRVGVARALARRPEIYLLDEPTAHLDTSLRGILQEELAEQRRADHTAALYATHEVGEALAVADRVALLRAGRIIQVAGPVEVYERPVDAWAARLTGPASVLTVDDRIRLAAAVDPTVGEIMVRPEWAVLGGTLPGRVEALFYRGAHTDYRLATPWGNLVVRAPGPPRLAQGTATTWALSRCWPLSPPAVY